VIDTRHKVSSGVKNRGSNLKDRKPRGERRRDLGQQCGGQQEEHQRGNPRHPRNGPHVDAIAPREPLADRPAVTRAAVLLKLSERTPLEPGQEHVRLHRKARNQHDRRNDYRRSQPEKRTGAQKEEYRRCARRETRKHDPHDERERAQRAFPQIMLERLIVL
jgi:hypothetical protein